MQEEDYKFIAELVKRRSGIDLGVNGNYLIDARLRNLIRELNIDSVERLLTSLKENPSSKLLSQLIDAMTTNESLFFRDNKPFEILVKTLLPSLLESRKAQKTIRIWSAACSTGQEP